VFAGFLLFQFTTIYPSLYPISVSDSVSLTKLYNHSPMFIQN